MPRLPSHLQAALASATAVLALCAGPLAAQCDALIGAESLEAGFDGGTTRVCLDLEYAVGLRSTRILDGVTLSGTAPGCNYDTLYYYPYDNLTDASPTGPYTLDEWVVGASTYNGTFADIPGLVALMNTLDPGASWTQDAATSNIVGGVAGRGYDRLVATPDATGVSVTIRPNLERTAGGTGVDVSGAGYHEFVVDDPDSGCRDTVEIFLRPTFDDAELQLFTDFDTPTSEFCAESGGLPGTPSSFTSCLDPTDGSLANTTGFCFTYDPDAGTTGTDRACIEVCDDTRAPYGPICRRTNVEVIVRSPVMISRDTVPFSISNADTTVCLDAVVDVLRPYDRVELCAPEPTGLSAGLGGLNESPCVALLPEPSFEGRALLCVAYCTGANCDTTVLDVSVAARCQADVFAVPVDSIADAGDPTAYCVGIARAVVGDYAITVDGAPYAGAIADCDMETRFSYDFGPLASSGRAPFELVDWFVDGRTTSGTFGNLTALELLMRQFDPAGNWRLKPPTQAIRGGNETSSYGDLLARDADGVNYTVTPDPFGIATGVTVELPGAGTYEIEVERRDAANCSDAVTVVVGEGDGNPPDAPGGADTLDTVTVPVTFAGDGPVTACAEGLQIDRPYTDAVVEAVTGPYTAQASPRNGCILIDPSAPEAASGMVTALFCESADPTRCQRVAFAITQRGACPDGPFAAEAETLAPSDDPVLYCLAGGADLSDYEIRLDGGVVEPQTVGGCGSGGGGTVTVFAYSVLDIEDVDYRIDAWNVNGNSLIRENTSGGLQGVADTMSAFDPDRDWTYDADLGLLHTTEAVGNYSPQLVLFDYRFSTGPTLVLETVEIPDPDGGGGDATGAAITLPGPGTFEVEVYNAALDCGDRISLTVPPATQPAIDTIRIVAEAGVRSGPFCVPVDELPGDITSFTICGVPQNGTVAAELPAGCFSYDSDGTTGMDTLCVVACIDNPALCDTTIYVIDVRADVPACADLLAVSSVTVDVDSCDALNAVCLPALPGDAADFSIAIDGVLRSDVAVCGSATLIAYDYAPIVAFASAGFTVQRFEVDGATFSGDATDAAAVVALLNTWDPDGAWSLDFAERRFIGGAGGSVYGDLEVVEAGGGAGAATLRPVALTVDNQVSVPLMTGRYELVVSDLRTGCAQSVDLEVQCGCPRPLPTAFSRGVDCSTSEVDVCLPILPEELAGYTLTVDGSVYGGPVSPCAEETVLVIDALELYGSPSPPTGPTPFRVDSIVIGGDVFSADVPGGAPELATLLDDWDDSADWRYDDAQQLIIGGSATTTYSSLFVSGGTLLPGADPREIVLEPTVLPTGSRITIPAGAGPRALRLDDGGGCGYDIALTLVCTQVNIRADTIDVLETELFCVDESELTGPIVRVFNACPDAGASVEFDFDAPVGCFTATGLAPGSTEGCIVACDVNGVCDTTLWRIFVNPEASEVRAVDDAFAVRVDETIVESIVANDFFGALTSLTIMRAPERGVASLSDAGLLTYTPAAGECGFTDSLRYELCSGQTCSEATVYLRVRCGLVEAVGGFSPNGDGVNETFVVSGIEDYPEATVRVFNRWGNRVFESTTAYANDWDGVWDGNRLPAGTYFYLVEIPGEGEVTGSVQLWR